MIHSPEAFAAARPAGFDGVFDWDFLKPAFEPTAIEPMDFDAVVERGGRFLVFETKDGAGVVIKDGQRRSLEAAIRTGAFTVVVLRCKIPSEIRGWEVWRKKGQEINKTYYEGGANELVEFTRKWFLWATDSADSLPNAGQLLSENEALKKHLAEIGRRPALAPVCQTCGLLINGEGFNVGGKYVHRGQCAEWNRGEGAP